MSACAFSLKSGRCRSSEFIWRVLIFSVVFLTKLETLKKRKSNKNTTCHRWDCIWWGFKNWTTNSGGFHMTSDKWVWSAFKKLNVALQWKGEVRPVKAQLCLNKIIFGVKEHMKEEQSILFKAVNTSVLYLSTCSPVFDGLQGDARGFGAEWEGEVELQALLGTLGLRTLAALWIWTRMGARARGKTQMDGVLDGSDERQRT